MANEATSDAIAVVVIFGIALGYGAARLIQLIVLWAWQEGATL